MIPNFLAKREALVCKKKINIVLIHILLIDIREPNLNRDRSFVVAMCFQN